jgi:uncharacterized protein (TIGR02453 family)
VRLRVLIVQRGTGAGKRIRSKVTHEFTGRTATAPGPPGRPRDRAVARAMPPRARARGYARGVTFEGWPAEALEFYEGLEADNSKTYWTAHKAVYDADVYAPMAALLAELEDEFGEGKIFRPNRDVRFSADKSPYKTAIGAVLGGGGYVQLSADGLGAGHGYHMMASDQLERYRAAVADDRTGERLRELIAEVERHGIEVRSHDRLKGAPRGYPKDHPRLELLRNKNLIAWRQWPVQPWLGTAAAKRRVVEFLRAARPLAAWLDDQVGPSDLPRGR